jgi:hypothetical protein
MDVVASLAAAAGHVGNISEVNTGLRAAKKMTRFCATDVRIWDTRLMFARLCFTCIVRGLHMCLPSARCYLCLSQQLLLLGLAGMN